jgi:hypothetical protein
MKPFQYFKSTHKGDSPEVDDPAQESAQAVDAPEPDPTTTVRIGDIKLQILSATKDGAWYQQRKSFEERGSLLYQLICKEGFDTFVDIGANIGYISLLARRGAPHIRILAVEADPRLIPVIRVNLETDGVDNAVVLHAILGDTNDSASQFSLNPSSTLDNRVEIESWEHVDVPTRTMDSLLEEHKIIGKTFFKIDTQGYEQRVLLGLQEFLAQSTNWMLKMEFAPNWLTSQGTDPAALLNHLIDRYEVAEYPERIPYGTDSLNSLFAFPLEQASVDDFVAYVRSLNRDSLGWVDLIVRPLQQS